jgi:hypothetical protein
MVSVNSMSIEIRLLVSRNVDLESFRRLGGDPPITSPSKDWYKKPPAVGCALLRGPANMRYTGNGRHILLMMNNFSRIDVTVVGGWAGRNGSRLSSRQGWTAGALH